MNFQTIGILGSNGSIGRILVKRLKKRYRIITTYHSKKRNPTDIYIDVYKPKTLIKIIEQCDIIINCTGPSYLISPQIAKLLNKSSVPYIDLFGGDVLENVINFEERTTPQIINAGAQPGLSGLLVLRMLELCESIPIHMEIYQGGNEIGGQNAFLDILLSIQNGYGKSNICINQNQEAYDSSEHLIKIQKDKIAIAQLYLTKELERIMKEASIQSVKSYFLFGNKNAKTLLSKGYAILTLKNVTMTEKISKIKSLLEKHHTEEKQWFVIQIYAEEEKVKREIRLIASDSNEISALVTELCLEQLINGYLEPNCYWASDILDTELTIKQLVNNGMDYREHVVLKEKYVEEGEL